MSRPRQDLWSPDEHAWLREVYEGAYPIEDIAATAGRTVTAIKTQATALKLRRPQGYSGPAIRRFHDALAGPIPEFPGGSPDEARGPRRPNGQAEGDPDATPPRGWNRRCQGCPTIFQTFDLDQTWCAECLAANDAVQVREAARSVPTKSPMKTSSWFGQS